MVLMVVHHSGQLSTVSTQERKVGVATDTPPQQADPEISAGAGSGLQIPSTPSDPNTVVPSTVTPPSPTSAPCSSLVAEARVLARDIAVNINVPPTSPAASNLKIIWTKRTRVRVQVPLYIVLTAPPEVRFGGNGFAALTAGAVGPYQMNYGKFESRD